MGSRQVFAAVPTIACAALVVLAVARAMTAPLPADASVSTPEQQAAAFKTIVSEEAAMREEAAREFPGDAWSQDDDFHKREEKRARAYASKRNMRLADVLLAVDDGLHHRWPMPANVSPRPGVPPCRPRLSY